jgi:hypothetical protein
VPALDIGVFFGSSACFSAGYWDIESFSLVAIIAFYSIGIGYWLFFLGCFSSGYWFLFLRLVCCFIF